MLLLLRRQLLALGLACLGCGTMNCGRSGLSSSGGGGTIIYFAVASVIDGTENEGSDESSERQVSLDQDAWDELERASSGQQFDGLDPGQVDFTGKVDSYEFDVTKSFEENVEEERRRAESAKALRSSSAPSGWSLPKP